MDMAPSLFINYRRSDSAHAANGLYAQLEKLYGPSRVFMDVASIESGAAWPERISRALQQSSVVLAVIGQGVGCGDVVRSPHAYGAFGLCLEREFQPGWEAARQRVI